MSAHPEPSLREVAKRSEMAGCRGIEKMEQGKAFMIS